MPTDDLNKYLKLKLKKGVQYRFEFADQNGNAKTKTPFTKIRPQL